MSLLLRKSSLDEGLYFPTPLSISIWWNFGVILGIILVLQIVTGLVLSMHYTADMINTFGSVMHLIRDVPGGWALRSAHANGASFFFVFMYLHIGRGLYYKSYKTQPLTWMVGVTLLLLAMATAFFGYVLPWGQMSYWGATVITNLLSAVPVWGPSIVEWVWGGFTVSQSTLNRFFTFHFILPFMIAALSSVHVLFLHEKGSSNPLGELSHGAKIGFHPYYVWKDAVGLGLLLAALIGLCFYYPAALGDPQNFICANPMVTPTHIQPEWYFLFAYAILRSIPSKLGGVLALVSSVLVLYLLPLTSKKAGRPFSASGSMAFWGFVIVFFILTWLGACPIEDPYLTLAGPCTLLYFILILLFSGGSKCVKL